MFRGKMSFFVFGLMLALCSPVLARERGEDAVARFVATSTAPVPQVQEGLDKLFYRWDSYQLDLPALERQVRANGRIKLQAGGRVFDMQLKLNNLRAPGFKQIRQTPRGPVEEKPAPVATFKGHLVGDPDSNVRLLIQPDFFQGYIRTAEEWIFIDPMRKYSPASAPSEIVLFDDDDVRPEGGALCGSGELAHRANSLESLRDASSVTEKALTKSPILREADIAIEADYEYFQIFSGSTVSHMEGVINSVDGIYRTELALTLRIVFACAWTTPDPYTANTPGALIGEFASFWNTDPSRANVALNRDLAHLFTGNDTGLTQGAAAGPGGVICSRNSSYSYSRNHSRESKLAAHEIGHLFGADHDADSACGGPLPPAGADSCPGSGPIMCNCIQTNGSDSFSNTSKTAIATYVNNYGSCLAPLTTPVYPPTGYVDGYNEQWVWGWACDPDYPTHSNRVDIYTTSWQYLGSAEANQPSSAPINNACGGGSAHYFTFYHNGGIAPGTHFMVWSIDLPYSAPGNDNRPIGGNGAIGNGTEFVMPTPLSQLYPPTGWVDGYDQQHIWGWACDPDYPNESNRVDVYTTSWQYLGSADANGWSSAPINSACGGGWAHYFDFYHWGGIAPGTHFMVWSIDLPYSTPGNDNRPIGGSGSTGYGTEFVMP